MRRSTKITLYLCFLSLIATQYTNCESYNESTFASSDASSLSAASCNKTTDPNCPDLTNDNKEFLSLSINLTDIYVLSTDSFFSVSGTCFDANFPANSLRYKLIDASGNDIANNLSVAPTQQPKCERGEWDFQIILPPNFNRTQTSTLIIQMVAYNSLGEPVLNDLLAKKTITIRNAP